jgi:DNA-binding winged helix-turn-helix (wHTH) protein
MGAAVRFGAFALDSEQRRLTRADAELHLTPKAFDLLELLVAAGPRVMRKPELHELLWPRGVVSDATLVGLVKELRRALDDRDDNAPIIRTVHRVGYGFCLAVEREEGAPVAKACGWLVTKERRLALSPGENLIGRDPRAQVWLDHDTVSRRHARIVADARGALLEDLGSKNGTRVAERPIQGAASLRDGDRVSFGEIALVYRSASPSQVTATQLTRKGRN